MTTTPLPHPTRLARAVVTAAALAVTVLALGACGSVPYAADAGSATTPPAGGGAPGSTPGSAGSAGGAGSPGSAGSAGGGFATGGLVTGPGAPPDMPTDPRMTHGPVTAPDTAVSATDQPGQRVPGPAVAGKVTDASGKPVSGLLVTVVSHGDPMVAVPEIGVLTGDDGRYAWPALPPGPWEVQVTRDGHTASVRVTLRSGRTATADLVLR